MEIKEHKQAFTSLELIGQIFKQMHFRIKLPFGLEKFTIKIFPRSRRPWITHNNSIGIHHWNYEKIHPFPQYLSFRAITTQKIYKSFDNMRAIRLARMNTPAHENILLLTIFYLPVVRNMKDGDWHPSEWSAQDLSFSILFWKFGDIFHKLAVSIGDWVSKKHLIIFKFEIILKW